VDHGIESPERRTRAGKPRRGTVKLTAALQGDRVLVTLADDGAGLDLAAIGAQLVQRGLTVPDDPQQLAQSVFLGGLSTRAEATAISGRGVGLDIVRSAVQRIRGTVEVRSEPGRGTSFTIECPPSLATIRVLLASVGPQLVAIPISSVERLLRLKPEAVRRAEGRDVVLTDETPIPLVPLARLLPPLIERPVAGVLNIVVLRAGGRRLAVVVDELINEQEIVLRPVKVGGCQLGHIGGAAILGMGRVALVVNPGSLVTAGLSDRVTSRGSIGLRQAIGDGRKRLLVVDDSITTRTLEQSILESAGYEVVTAVDGADGWRIIQEQGCDLVVSDVEMPRMDGFALCQAIRASSRFKELPVVLITALEKPEDRARGLEAGADAYLGKSSFDQNNLLETVRQLVGAQ
jgi:two-component system chemotaxis sensor kinase CheA